MAKRSRHPRSRRFALVERYIGTRMGCDVSALVPGRPAVVETLRRLRREKSYGYDRVLWWIWLEDGRSAVSVPPGAGQAVRKIARHVASAEQLFEPELSERLKGPVNAALEKAGLGEVDRVFTDLQFVCDGEGLLLHCCGDCRRLTDDSIPPAEGLELPTHCFPDGIAYGVVADGMVVSFAFAHRTGLMEGRIADDGLETAPAYRRRGYAKTVLSALVEHVASRGGESIHVCRPDNSPSIATARSVGFLPFGRALVLGKRARDLPNGRESPASA